MKKFILIIFLCLALCVCIVACDVMNDNSDGSQTEETTTETQINDDLTSEAPINTEVSTTEEPMSEAPTMEELTTDVNNFYTVEDVSLIEVPQEERDNELIAALIKYLKEFWYDYEMPSTSFVIKINKIKTGEHPLFVQFDCSNYYYMCGYYNDTHEYDSYESFKYCCYSEYTWVKFDNENEILEYHGDEKFVVAFQINKSLCVKNILSHEISVPDIEHFQIYQTEFVDGVNVNIANTFDKMFIYLSKPYKDIVFYSTDTFDHNLNTLSCIDIGGELYAVIWTHTVRTDGTVNYNMLDWEFKGYYEELMTLMQTGVYSEEDDRGYIYYYGVFDIEDLLNCILC